MSAFFKRICHSLSIKRSIQNLLHHTSKVMTNLSCSVITKGDIGEGVARIGILLRGEKVLGKQDAAIEFVTKFGNLSKKAGRAVPDYIVQKNGVTKVVEAKFGTSQLTPAQRALRKEIGSDRFYISRESPIKKLPM